MSETQADYIRPDEGSFDIQAYSDETGAAFVGLRFTKGQSVRLEFPLSSAKVLRDALISAIDATEAGLAAEGAMTFLD